MHYSKAYTDATHTEPDGNPRLACAYVALKLAFSNNAGNFAPIVAQQWCYWPISINLEAGKKYTFVIDAATGGYQPGNVDAAASTDLDRVLAGLAIEFGSPTVETWVTDLNSDTENNDDIPVIM
jgi:hypothetical protein